MLSISCGFKAILAILLTWQRTGRPWQMLEEVRWLSGPETGAYMASCLQLGSNKPGFGGQTITIITTASREVQIQIIFNLWNLNPTHGKRNEKSKRKINKLGLSCAKLSTCFTKCFFKQVWLWPYKAPGIVGSVSYDISSVCGPKDIWISQKIYAPWPLSWISI